MPYVIKAGVSLPLTSGDPRSICALDRILTLHLPDRRAVLLLPSLTDYGLLAG